MIFSVISTYDNILLFLVLLINNAFFIMQVGALRVFCTRRAVVERSVRLRSQGQRGKYERIR